MEDRFLKRLGNKAKKGFRGWPMATVAFYGPDLSYASTRFIDGGSARQRRWELVCHFIMSRDSAAAPTSTSRRSVSRSPSLLDAARFGPHPLVRGIALPRPFGVACGFDLCICANPRAQT